MIKPIPDLTNDEIFRFKSKILQTNKDSCWLWLAGTTRGYGQFKIRGINYLASRIMYKLHYGIDPEQSLVLHKCDNPPCCNPDHLFRGTYSDNIVDSYSKGRYNGEQITFEQVKEMRMRYFMGETSKKLAEEFKLSERYVYNVVLEHRRKYK